MTRLGLIGRCLPLRHFSTLLPFGERAKAQKLHDFVLLLYFTFKSINAFKLVKFLYAYFVSTDNCGIKHLNHVFALSIIHGMEIGVKNQSYAQEIEYGILSITNACVEMDNFGTALFANGKRIVLEVKNGIQKHILAHALIVFIGMVKLVFFV